MSKPNLNRPLGKYEKEVENFIREVLSQDKYLNYCKSITKNDASAKDLLDEVIFKIFDNRYKYKSIKELRKIWYKTVQNTYIDQRRKESAKYTKAFWKDYEKYHRDRQNSFEDQDELRNREIVAFNARYILGNINDYIKHDFNRYIFMEHLFAEKTFDEMARELNIPEENKKYTVASLRVSKNRGKKELFKVIEQKHPNFHTEKIITSEDE